VAIIVTGPLIVKGFCSVAGRQPWPHRLDNPKKVSGTLRPFFFVLFFDFASFVVKKGTEASGRRHRDAGDAVLPGDRRRLPGGAPANILQSILWMYIQ